MSQNKTVRLYNVIFPPYIFFLIPFLGRDFSFFIPFFLIILVGNFIIDGGVLFAALFLLKEIKNIVRFDQLWIKVWLWGFFADIVGAGILFFCEWVNWFNSYNPLQGTLPVISVALPFIVVVVSGVIIGVGDYYFLIKHGASKAAARRTAFAMGVITAPWLFLLSPIGG